MENKLLKYAIIGIGNMGKNHVRTCADIPNVNLVAIVDINIAPGKELASQYEVKFYEDFKIMVEKEKPEAVSICVPTSLHYEVAKFCLEKRVHVLLEKPISMNLREGQELLELAKKQNVKLLVGHIERFNPAVQKVKEIIEKGELGKISSIIARRVGGFPPQIKDANISIDLAIHDVDIVNYLLGQMPKNIRVYKQRNHIEQREDSVELFLEYDYCSAYIQANWITPVKIRKLNITGTEGYLEMDYITQKIQIYQSRYEKFRTQIGNFSDFILRFAEPDVINLSIAKKEPLREELLYFIDAIQNDYHIDSQFALDALRIVNYEAQKTT